MDKEFLGMKWGDMFVSEYAMTLEARMFVEFPFLNDIFYGFTLVFTIFSEQTLMLQLTNVIPTWSFHLGLLIVMP